ncbi:MAG TPA: SRPBCC family protein [Acidimicrobiia bacterium]|nr:SRPBCC family protein [Acidimicrobiia bacterium]
MRLTARRHISWPAPEVFAFFADASNNPKWQHGMISCEWTSEPPIGVGSTYRQRARFLGRDVTSSFMVTDYEPGRLISIETTESTFPIKVVRIVDPTDKGSCEVAADISGGPENWFFGLIGPMIQKRAQKSVDADYDRLVQLLEA